MAKLLGEKARKRVLERYTLRDNITSLEKMYGDVAGKRELKLSRTV
jgi:hypothetical protein